MKDRDSFVFALLTDGTFKPASQQDSDVKYLSVKLQPFSCCERENLNLFLEVIF